MSESEREELLKEIREKLIKYTQKRAYSHLTASHEASVTIADNALLDADGKPLKFEEGTSQETIGIPSVQQGLENLNIKLDGGGRRVTFTVSTRKKLEAIKKNFNLWRDFHPRNENLLRGKPDQG